MPVLQSADNGFSIFAVNMRCRFYSEVFLNDIDQ